MILVTDTETGGLDAEKSDIVELAVVEIPSFETFSTFVSTDKPIELEAMATHHITPQMLEGAPTLEEAMTGSRFQDTKFVAAHNAAFDMSFLKVDKPVICTYRCARHLYPDAPRHTNQVLRYYLGLNEKVYEGVGHFIMQLPPHRALPDAWVTAHILEHMLKTHTPEELVALTSSPILIRTMQFGKHRGQLCADIPKDYWRWVSRQADMDPDVLYTANYYLVH